jgi:DNA-binding NtrC family response regulator
MATILYVDDEKALRRAVKLLFERQGDFARTASTARSAIGCLQRYRFDGVFLDLWLAGGSGLEVYDWLLEHQPALATRVAFITGELFPSPESAQRLAATGRPVIQKPFALTTLTDYARAWAAQSG